MELICYTYEGWDPRIRPASQKRDWMEDTVERFAYRCLPLAMANAHGWEVLSPCGFSARWTGGAGPEAVEVMLDAGTVPHQAPVSLFGAGTITFHLEGIFRTSEGWNLWIGGSPNAAKDGIAPLGGLIETDWSPYSFTMNWRFTRTDHWIRFEENEPFCFLFPVQRQAILDVAPQVRPIDERPELKQAFETWSKSRDAFHQWVQEAKPSAPTDKWQKLYYRGVNPDGSPGAPDHSSKMRLPPFQQPDGAPLQTGEMKTCPVAHAAPVPSTQGDAPMAAHAETLLAMPDLAPKPQPDPTPVAAPAPVPAPAPIDPAVELKRREWIMDTIERQRLLSPATASIPRVGKLSSQEFLDGYYAPSRPVVIQGAMEGWPALGWTTRRLVERVGSATIEYQGGRRSEVDFELYKDKHKQTTTFDRFIAMVTAGDVGNDAYITAYNSSGNGAALAPLHQDLGYLDQYLTRAHGMMWIGPLGTFTPLHYDLTNNLLAQITGSKRLILLPPAESSRLSNRIHVFSEVHDITDEDRLAHYPLARDAQTFEVDLEAGELLYIPVGWWHQVTSLDFSVMLTYTNFLWPNDPFSRFPG